MLRNIFIKLTLLSCTLLAGAFLYGCNGDGGAPAASNLGNPSATDPTNIQATIQGVAINSPPVVTFTLLDEKGTPLDPNDFIANGGSIRFTIAQIGADGNYQNYIRSSTPNQPGYDAGGTFATVGTGVYAYTFKTDIRDTTKTLSGLAFNPALTHTVAAQIQRTKGSLLQAVNPYLNFRPDGGAVAVTREVVAISNCNECHGKLAVHGGGRQEIALCILCHNPGPIDPETGNPIDMKDLIHKIHMGRKLPSHGAGGGYGIVGFGNAFISYSSVTYPLMSADGLASNTPMECTKCHKLGTDLNKKPFGKNVDNYKATPTKAKCTTCHDLTTFDGSTTITVRNGISTVTATAKPHNGNPSVNPTDADCAGCHPPGTAGTDQYNATVIGAHALVEQSTVFTGLNFQIISVTNGKPGLRPTVTFKITDKAGNSVDPNTGSFSLKLGYMPKGSADYTNAGLLPTNSPNSGNGTTVTRGSLPNNLAQPLSMSLTKVAAPSSTTPFPSGLTTPLTANGDGSYTVTFDETLITNPLTDVYTGGVLTTTGTYQIPATATGIGVIGLEGRKGFTIPATTPLHRPTAKTVNIGGQAVQFYFDLATGSQVTDPAKQRRMAVDIEKCKSCHSRITLHGANRVNSVGECVICHNPNGTDRGSTSRPAAKAIDGLDEQSINFQVMIHKIHTGEGLTFPYVVSSSGSNFSDVRYPGVRGDCLACHINTTPEPYILPLPANVLGTTTPTNRTQLPAPYPQSAEESACTSCHDGTVTQHNAAKGVSPTDSTICSNCHGAGSLKAVETVHPIIKR